jgi:hypothetical protein
MRGEKRHEDISARGIGTLRDGLMRYEVCVRDAREGIIIHCHLYRSQSARIGGSRRREYDFNLACCIGTQLDSSMWSVLIIARATFLLTIPMIAFVDGITI